MGLEAATYINQLNAAWPLGAADAVAQGDDHLRLLKSTIQASFPNITGAMTLTQAQLNAAAIKNEANTFTLAQVIAIAGAGLTLNGGAGVSKAAYTQFIGTDAASASKTYNVGVNPAGTDGALEIKPSGGALGIRMDSAGNLTLAGIAHTDLARLSVPNTFTASGGGLGAAAVAVSAVTPCMTLNQTGAAADNKQWDFTAQTETLRFRVVNDANNVVTNWLTVDRNGTTVDNIAAAATTLTFGGLASFTTAQSASGYPIEMASTVPGLCWNESSVTANNRRWDMVVDAEQFLFRAVNDAINSAANIMTVDRTANVIDAIAFTTNLLTVAGIHNGTATGGSGAPAIASGTYTPTLTNGTNIAASTSAVCNWLRVGNVVTVSGRVSVDPTTGGGTVSVIGISLPIASNFTTAAQCGGTSTRINNSAGGAYEAGIIEPDIANDRAQVTFAAFDIASTGMAFNFSYVVA